jgi:hypothetical protein
MYNFGSIPFFASNNNLVEKNPSGIPSCVSNPSLSGDPNPDSTLSVFDGDWLNEPIYFGYRWYVNNNLVGTDSTYTIVEADLGFELKCIVSAANDVGRSTASTRSVLIIPREE